MLCSWRYMSEKRGWKSPDTLNRARQELIDRGLIVQTVQGRMPNKASWYAIGWCALDNLDGLDIKPQGFPRGAYRHWNPAPLKTQSPVRKSYIDPLNRYGFRIWATDRRYGNRIYPAHFAPSPRYGFRTPSSNATPQPNNQDRSCLKNSSPANP